MYMEPIFTVKLSALFTVQLGIDDFKEFSARATKN